MELKAIYLSYTTWSSIHNQKTESRTKMHLLRLGGEREKREEGELVWARDNEHDEKERCWRLGKMTEWLNGDGWHEDEYWYLTGSKWWLRSFPTIMILNYLGKD